jgi:Domain of unknown function (DUF222)
VSAAPRRESQEEILQAALASLTDEDIPPDDDELDGWPDPDSDRPAELAGLDGAELEDLAAGVCGPSAPAWPLSFRDSAGAQAWPAGFGPRDRSGDGPGFADGGVLDVLAAGLPLAGFAADAHERLGQVTDDELVGVLRAWRRVTSWAAASELAAVAELARRRPADGSPPAPPGRLPVNISEFVPEEVAAALTLTGRAAQDEVALALDLAGPLAATGSALAAGRIDLAKTKIIAAGVATLSAAHAAAVQAAVLPDAPDLTTGQLRRATARAVLTAGPGAAARQREEDLQHARVDCWPDPVGTASLAGYHLPAAAVLAADARLTRIARQWRKQGAGGGIDLLRAWAYLALLLGHDTAAPPPCLLAPDAPAATRRPEDAPDADLSGSAGTAADQARTAVDQAWAAAGGEPVPAGLHRPAAGTADPGLPPLAGSVNLTIPLATLLGLSQAPGAAAGYGPLDPATARALACAAAGHRATRWHITVTGPAGRALGHGTARAAAAAGNGWTVAVTAEPLAAGCCDHRTAEPGYRPSPACSGSSAAAPPAAAGLAAAAPPHAAT